MRSSLISIDQDIPPVKLNTIVNDNSDLFLKSSSLDPRAPIVVSQSTMELQMDGRDVLHDSDLLSSQGNFMTGKLLQNFNMCFRLEIK